MTTHLFNQTTFIPIDATYELNYTVRGITNFHLGTFSRFVYPLAESQNLNLNPRNFLDKTRKTNYVHRHLSNGSEMNKRRSNDERRISSWPPRWPPCESVSVELTERYCRLDGYPWKDTEGVAVSVLKEVLIMQVLMVDFLHIFCLQIKFVQAVTCNSNLKLNIRIQRTILNDSTDLLRETSAVWLIRIEQQSFHSNCSNFSRFNYERSEKIKKEKNIIKNLCNLLRTNVIGSYIKENYKQMQNASEKPVRKKPNVLHAFWFLVSQLDVATRREEDYLKRRNTLLSFLISDFIVTVTDDILLPRNRTVMVINDHYSRTKKKSDKQNRNLVERKFRMKMENNPRGLKCAERKESKRVDETLVGESLRNTAANSVPEPAILYYVPTCGIMRYVFIVSELSFNLLIYNFSLKELPVVAKGTKTAKELYFILDTHIVLRVDGKGLFDLTLFPLILNHSEASEATQNKLKPFTKADLHSFTSSGVEVHLEFLMLLAQALGLIETSDPPNPDQSGNPTSVDVSANEMLKYNNKRTSERNGNRNLLYRPTCRRCDFNGGSGALQAFQACTTTTLGLVVPAILLPAATPPSRRTTITRVDEHDDDDDEDEDDDDDVASNSVSAVDGGASGPRVLPSGPSTRQQHAHGRTVQNNLYIQSTRSEMSTDRRGENLIKIRRDVLFPFDARADKNGQSDQIVISDPQRCTLPRQNLRRSSGFFRIFLWFYIFDCGKWQNQTDLKTSELKTRYKLEKTSMRSKVTASATTERGKRSNEGGEKASGHRRNLWDVGEERSGTICRALTRSSTLDGG
ncbi:hypothetical protein WN51_13973 [Melipona quadrifasciata]|uniref:Uncharacterized protein n=1 Tax=Melipona quadrifasciata TaxID=166423 RepID=A0A0M8ZYV0_9HYME|nr:hypothetical protein WN51_13973 [Melipona quadrifasciata]